MYLQNQLLQADQEIKNGLKFRAVNRLRNVINIFPDDIEVRNKLAEIYYEAGFYDAAGLFWILTEPTEQYMKDCIAIYKASVNNSSVQILKEIKYRGGKSGLSLYAIQKLNALEQDVQEKTQSSKTYNKQLNKESNHKSYWIEPGLILVILLGLIFLNGLFDIIRMLWNLFF